MDCGSLASVLARHGPLPEPGLARVTADVLGGLDHLHRVLKVLHRDIKPSNVLLNSRGEVKLADFGMSGQLASTFSRLASWVGTAAYMSPERISGAEYSYESDVWALGVTLWELSVGQYPYGARQPLDSNASTPTAMSAPCSTPTADAAAAADGLLPEEQRLGLSFWDLLHAIVECAVPKLPDGRFSPHFAVSALPFERALPPTRLAVGAAAPLSPLARSPLPAGPRALVHGCRRRPPTERDAAAQAQVGA